MSAKGTQQPCTHYVSLIIDLTDAVEVHASDIVAQVGQESVSLECSLYGYVPTRQLRWFRMGSSTNVGTAAVEEIYSNSRYTITHTTGEHMIQMGGATPERSIVGVLTVSDVVASDEGRYLCGTSLHDAAMIAVSMGQVIVPTQGT